MNHSYLFINELPNPNMFPDLIFFYSRKPCVYCSFFEQFLYLKDYIIFLRKKR